MKRIAVIVAGGKGLRMGKDLPKQFLSIGNKNPKPILMWTIENFTNNVDDIILVLPKDYIEYWQSLLKKYNFGINHKVVIGGETRFHSVLSALNVINEEAIVLIHDAVRPFITSELINNLSEMAHSNMSAIPYIDMIDSIRKKEEDDIYISVNRKDYVRIQTPQAFLSNKIKEAYSTSYRDDFTDDASVFEYYYKIPVNLIKSSENNIKITNQIDLEIANILIRDYE